MTKILEGFWDCKYCGTTQIGGSLRECPNCGKARGEDTYFYLDETVKQYVPEEKARTINRNPDWVCNYCNQLNSDSKTTCVSCGAPRTAENLNYFEHHAQKNQSSNSHQKSTNNSSNFHDSNHSRTPYTNHHSESVSGTASSYGFDMPGTTTLEEGFAYVKNFFTSHFSTLLITFLIVIGFLGMVFLLLPKDQEITINEFTWSRTIEIERYQTVEESNWSLPAGSRLLYTREELSHYENVLDHYETKTRQVAKQRISGYETYVSGYRDLGNGYFEEITSSRPIYETYYETETYQEAVYRSVPIYRTKYYYEIDKWLYERSVKTSGCDKSPYWGEINLNSDERVSTKYGTYTITGMNQDEKEQSIILSFEDWSSVEIGQTIKVKVSIGGYGEIIKIPE